MRVVSAFTVLAFTGCHESPRDTAMPRCTPPTLELQGAEVTFRAEGCAAATLAVRVVGEGNPTVTLAVEGGRLVPTVYAGAGGGTLRALVLEGTDDIAGDGPLRWWRQGYQSWSWAGVVEAGTVALDADGLPEVGGQGTPDTFLRDEAGTS
jgi:hypothetical protein